MEAKDPIKINETIMKAIFDENACSRCPLKGKTRVPFEIKNEKTAYEYNSPEEFPECHIVFVGEAPGHMEELHIRPFIHRAGKLLRTAIEKVLNEFPDLRDQIKIMITNACKCKPTREDGEIRAPLVEEISTCRKNLEKDLKIARPRLIVALGKTASIALKVPEGRKKLEDIRGKLYDTEYGKVFVTYHPSAILRNNLKNVKTFENDIRNAFIILLNTIKKDSISHVEKEVPTFEIQTKVITNTEELKKEFENLKRQVSNINGKSVLSNTAFDYETVPFDWSLFPEENTILKTLGLEPLNKISDIAFVSVAYFSKIDKINKKYTITSFSFPVRARKMLENIKTYVEENIEKLESNQKTLIDEILKIYRERKERTISVKLELYFLYKDFHLSRELIDEISSIIENDEDERKIRYKVEDILRDYVRKMNTFLKQIDKAIREYESLFNELDEETCVSLLKEYLANKDIKKIAQNPQFEIAFSIEKLGIEPFITGATDLLDYLLGNTSHKLSELERRYIFPHYKANKVVNYVPKDRLRNDGNSLYNFAIYNAHDSAKTLLIYYYEMLERKKYDNIRISNSYKEITFYQAIKAAKDFLLRVTTPFSVYSHKEGIKLDFQKCKELSERVHFFIKKLKERIKEISGFEEDDLRSDEFREKLYKMYEKDPIYTSKDKKPSIAKNALEIIYQTTENPHLKELVLCLYSVYKYEGLLSRYLEKYPFYVNPFTQRVHPQYNIVKTASGRISCQDPNIQQVPREPFASCPECYVVPFENEKNCPLCGKELKVLVDFREAFIPEEGNYLVMADYSQIEMVVLAELSKDKNLIEAINQGLDMHSYNASNVYGIPYDEIVSKKDSDPDIARYRQNAKRVTFAVIYGATEEGIAKRENMDPAEAKRIIDTFYNKHPMTKIWIDERHKEALEKGMVLVPTGRPRWFVQNSEENSVDETTKKLICRRAQNTPIQGFASDINLITCEILRRKYGVKVIGAIHDSILAEIKEDEKEKFEEWFYKAVEETNRLKDSLKDILELNCVSDIVENLSVKLRAEAKFGKSWKEVK